MTARVEVHTMPDQPDYWLVKTTVRNTSALRLIAGTKARRTETSVAEWTVPATIETARQLKTSLPEARWSKEAAKQRARLAEERRMRIRAQTSFKKPLPVTTPSGATEELAAFQASGSTWLAGYCGVLADDMGLGKTVQICYALEQLRQFSPDLNVLILCPASAIGVWLHHLEHWTSVTPFLFHGPRRKKVHVDYLAYEGPKALLSTHGLLEKHSYQVNYGSVAGEGKPGEFNEPFDICIVDEAHKIGIDPAGKRVRSMAAVRNTCGVVWPSTGTPVDSHPKDMWVLMSYTAPHVFGSYQDFVTRYCIERLGPHDRPVNLGLHPDMEAEYEWMIKPWVLRRLKKTHAPEIPEGREPQIIELDMTGPQTRAYKEVVDHSMTMLADASGKKKLAFVQGNLSKNTLLQYVACGVPIMDEDRRVEALDTRNSNKLAYILELADDREGDPFVVYAYSAKEARMYVDGLTAAGHRVGSITGKVTSHAKRTAVVKLFQEGELDVMVVTNAGGDSITLTAADLIVLTRPSWRPLDNQQVMDRINRWGQKRQPMAQILVSRGTVDETRLAALSGKVKLQDEMTLDSRRLKAFMTGKL